MKRVIVNVAVGGYHGNEGVYYKTAQQRLIKSLQVHGKNIDNLFWSYNYPTECPSHAQVPYLFKFHALKEAVDKGYQLLLWVDAPMIALRSMEIIFKQIEEDGYLLWNHPPGQWTAGVWSSDKCLAVYDVNRKEAFDIPLVCGGTFGYSLGHPQGRKLHETFMRIPHEALCGAWHNKGQVISKDARVMGHRHDQVVLAILAKKFGLKLSPTPYPVAFNGHQNDLTVLVHDPKLSGHYVI